jgi:hypothetical protein
MLPFQGKIGAVVIESLWKPAFGHMAPGTISYPLDCERFTMDVFMATPAICIQISEFLFPVRLFSANFDEMTSAASYFGMLPIQGPGCL